MPPGLGVIIRVDTQGNEHSREPMAKPALKAVDSKTDNDDTAEKFTETALKDTGGVAGQRLKSFIDRVERMDEEIKALQEDRKDIFAEAKGVGFDVPTIRRIIKERKMEPQKVREQLELFELYKSAIGM